MTKRALRVGLGCMRLSTEPERDDARSLDVLRAALDAGVTLFDTARAYCLDDDDRGHNERLLAAALAGVDVARLRIITKGGMTRPGGRWLPDGRAKAIVADCHASRAALGGLPIHAYLLHAPDPDVDFAVSVRALASLLDKGLVHSVGLSNVTRAQLDAALAIVPVSCVELSLSWLDDTALKSGVLARCIERGIDVVAHRPLGGAKKQRTLARDAALREIAQRHMSTPAHVALAAVLDLDERVHAIPGATTAEHARELAHTDELVAQLDDADRALLAPRLDRRDVRGPRPPSTLRRDGEVVLVMGLQGAGKSTHVATWMARGYERINRDERGGTMKQLHAHLEQRALDATSAPRFVLDNTYLTRAQRRDAIDAAWRAGLAVRGVWLDTPLADAQVNVVLRMLAAHGRLLEPLEMARAKGPTAQTALAPNALFRSVKALEPPDADEGFAQLDVVPFMRARGNATPSAATPAPHLVTLEAYVARGADALGPVDAPHLVLVWAPGHALDDAARAALVAARADVTFAVCAHGAGPPVCWCRPPLPGLALAWAHERAVDLAKATLVGTGPAHRALAVAIGAAYVDTT